MSGICGIVNWDGAPVDSERLKKMAEAAAYRGPDGITYWIDGNVGLAHLAFHTTPELLRERQPLVNRRGDVVLTADARVDNRDELIPLLLSKGYLQDRDPTDADLILAAYECWGEECPKQIVGDYAFAIWNARSHSLYAARDAFGVRPFYYSESASTCVFASSIQSVSAVLETPQPINWPLLEDMLAGVFDRWVHETAYETIFRLPQSYYLVAAANGASLTRYWILGAQPEVRYRTDAEYIAHFRQLFKQAVKAQLRSSGPVSILLSGGVDSSSVACMAEELVASGDASVPVHSYSTVFDYSPEADEREYINLVVHRCPHLGSTIIGGDDCWCFQERIDTSGSLSGEPNVLLDQALLQKQWDEARQDGSKVNLYGAWADQLLGLWVYHSPLTLKDVHWSHVLSELPFYCRSSQRSVWSLLTSAYIRPLIPRTGLGIGRRLAQWRGTTVGNGAQVPLRRPSAVTYPAFLPVPHLTAQISREIYSQLTGGLNSARLAEVDKMTAQIGIEQRAPYLDRRLVSFAFALPPRLLFRGGVHKYILRESMTDILPAEVRQRTDKARFDELVERGLRERERSRVQSLLLNARLVSTGLVDSQHLQRAWSRYWADGSYNRWHLFWALSVELWLRGQEDVGQVLWRAEGAKG